MAINITTTSTISYNQFVPSMGSASQEHCRISPSTGELTMGLQHQAHHDIRKDYHSPKEKNTIIGLARKISWCELCRYDRLTWKPQPLEAPDVNS